MLIPVLVLTAVLGEPVVVIDRTLATTTGELVSLRDGVAVLKTQAGEGEKPEKTVRVERPVAFVKASGWGPQRDWPGLPKDKVEEPGSVWVELTDGTALRGKLQSGKGDALVLVNKAMGKVEFPLDGLRTLVVSGEGPGLLGSKSGDTLVLANGDTLDGYVESITAQKEGTGLAVTLERDKTKTTVPLDRVAWVRLNGASSKPGQIAWLQDGERTAAAELSIEKGEARIARTKGGLAATLTGSQIEGVLINPAAAVPLAACKTLGAPIDSGSERTLGTRDLTMPEPGTTQWALPAGAAHMTGWAVLPEECRQWGNCTVTIGVSTDQHGGPAQVAVFTLEGTNPVAKIDVDLPAPGKDPAWLTVTVGEGKNGPVQDRVTLRRVMVGFVRTPAASAP